MPTTYIATKAMPEIGAQRDQAVPFISDLLEVDRRERILLLWRASCQGIGARVAGVPRFRYVVADVFTDTPLQGNQVAVFTDAREIPEDKLQPIAREMNYSETVFVYKPDGEGHAKIRIFTPLAELPFAGHPTLGTAFILSAPLQTPELRLETARGIVPVWLEREENRLIFGRMEQPIPSVQPYQPEEELFGALGV